ncbi:MAG: hypothetical protein WCG00_18775, partial [Hyphomicrobiales bacterium]
MAEKDVKNRVSAFTKYLDDIGVKQYELTTEGGKYHYHGTRKGAPIAITFDPGTIPDGTYNVFVSDPQRDSQWQGVISPGKDGAYTLHKKGEKQKQPVIEPPAEKAPTPKEAEAPAAAKPKASGKYAIHIVRDIEQDDSNRETGRIVITDPNNEIKANCEYISGSRGAKHAPHVEKYLLERNICVFTPIGQNKKPQNGLRIKDDTFKGLGRDSILIHEDKPPVGTLGCFGIKDAESWAKFEKAWNDIPKEQRPCEMCPLKKEEYDKLKELPQNAK